MFKTYVKIAWRSVMKNKMFSFINIFGLSVGLTCCILITLYIVHETSYDKFFANRDHIYRLGTIFIDQGVEDKGGNTSAPLGKMLQQEYPEVQSSARLLNLFRDDKTLFQVQQAGGKMISFYETKGFLADSNFFQILTYQFKEGDPKNALLEPNSVVINEDIAKKLFGDESAINKCTVPWIAADQRDAPFVGEIGGQWVHRTAGGVDRETALVRIRYNLNPSAGN